MKFCRRNFCGKTGYETLKRENWFSKPLNEYQLMSMTFTTKSMATDNKKMHIEVANFKTNNT